MCLWLLFRGLLFLSAFGIKVAKLIIKSNNNTDVNNSYEVLQFAITDVGSRWVETETELTIKHKGNTKKIKSKIGIKMTPGFARRKGIKINKHGIPQGQGH